MPSTCNRAGVKSSQHDLITTSSEDKVPVRHSPGYGHQLCLGVRQFARLAGAAFKSSALTSSKADLDPSFGLQRVDDFFQATTLGSVSEVIKRIVISPDGWSSAITVQAHQLLRASVTEQRTSVACQQEPGSERRAPFCCGAGVA
jgi:hypothetical protein